MAREVPEEVLEVGDSTPPRVIDVGSPSRVVERPVQGRLLSEALVRASLALIFVGIFGLTIIWAFINVGEATWANTRALLELLLPAETALLGSAVGFYFGSRQS